MVVQHPESLYCAGKGASGEDIVQANQDDGETIANTQFQYNQFTEDDSQIFYQLLEQYYALIKLSHGYLADQIKYHKEDFNISKSSWPTSRAVAANTSFQTSTAPTPS